MNFILSDSSDDDDCFIVENLEPKAPAVASESVENIHTDMSSKERSNTMDLGKAGLLSSVQRPKIAIPNFDLGSSSSEEQPQDDGQPSLDMTGGQNKSRPVPHRDAVPTSSVLNRKAHVPIRLTAQQIAQIEQNRLAAIERKRRREEIDDPSAQESRGGLKERRGQEISGDSSGGIGAHQNERMVACPMCSRNFPKDEIEQHVQAELDAQEAEDEEHDGHQRTEPDEIARTDGAAARVFVGAGRREEEAEGRNELQRDPLRASSVQGAAAATASAAAKPIVTNSVSSPRNVSSKTPLSPSDRRQHNANTHGSESESSREKESSQPFRRGQWNENKKTSPPYKKYSPPYKWKVLGTNTDRAPHQKSPEEAHEEAHETEHEMEYEETHERAREESHHEESYASHTSASASAAHVPAKRGTLFRDANAATSRQRDEEARSMFGAKRRKIEPHCTSIRSVTSSAKSGAGLSSGKDNERGRESSWKRAASDRSATARSEPQQQQHRARERGRELLDAARALDREEEEREEREEEEAAVGLDMAQLLSSHRRLGNNENGNRRGTPATLRKRPADQGSKGKVLCLMASTPREASIRIVKPTDALRIATHSSFEDVKPEVDATWTLPSGNETWEGTGCWGVGERFD